jgi:hypothetical protein
MRLPLHFFDVDQSFDTREDRVKAAIQVYHIRVVHLFDTGRPYGGCTVAYAPEVFDNTGYPKGKFAKVSVAWCNNRDRYSRPEGELVAVEKLLSNQFLTLPIYQRNHPVRTLKEMFWPMVINEVYENSEVIW